LHHYLKRYEEELEILAHVIDLDKRNAQAYFMRGMVHKDMGDTLKAMSSMQLAVQMDPDYYNAYIQMGLIAADQKNPLAVDYYRNALEIQPTSEEALYNLGMYYQQTDQYNPAIETYTALLKVNPHHFDAHFNLGMIHAYKLDVVDEGLKYFEMAILDNPGEPRGYYGRGYCYETKGNVDAATADYKKALEIDPQYTNAAKALSNLQR
jgi:tetratricopeptide (TPR) repeat protein